MKSAPAMIPIVFCASFAPCMRLKAAADTSCILRKKPSTRRGDDRRNTQRLATIRKNPTVMPTSGAITMKISVRVHPSTMMAEKPALTIAAPA